MYVNRKKEENPMFTKKGAWLWLLCAPAALVVSAHFESKKDIDKRKRKRRKKEDEFRRKYPEFDWWQDDQGL